MARMTASRSTLALLFVTVLLLAGCRSVPSDHAGPVLKTSDASASGEPSRTPYFESFDKGCGGWLSGRRDPLAVWGSVAYCYGPWYVDPWHAPPGAGYLHLVMWTHTKGAHKYKFNAGYPGNGFCAQNKSTDLTNAKVTLRLRGEVDLKGAQLTVLVQARRDKKTNVNYTLTGQSFKVTPQWSEQTVTLVADPDQWVCMGKRHNLQDYMRVDYGCSSIAETLRDVDVDIIFILFPLNVVPVDKSITDPHEMRPGYDYHVQQELLPKGLILFDWVKIEYAGRS